MTSEAMSAKPDLARIVFYVGAAIAVSHWADEWLKTPMPWGPAWKASGIVLLGIYVAMNRAWLPALAFLFASIGDVALELPNMIAGMAAFGVAHIFYGASFATIIRRDGVMWKAWPLCVVLLAISVELGVWLYPGMKELTGPALGYQVIISSMAILALMSRAPLTAKVAAVVLMVSDTLLAASLFREMPNPPGSVWITYAVAQILMAHGMVKALGRREAPQAG